ncbi:MAG: patatin-like phospholipase family protein [Chloroflexota bacterium]
MEINLALGGGGAKGFAHLGVLRGLEREGYQVKAIAGTSAGGIVGALYAAGYSVDEMVAHFVQIDRANLYGRQPGDGPSLLGVAGVNHLMKEMLGERTFEELPIPLALTAVDLNTGGEVVLRHGRVVDAVLATMALPGIFPPQTWEEYYLVDGGLLDPVPVAPVRALSPSLPVVAVALTKPSPSPVHTLEAPAFLKNVPVLNQITRLRVAQAFNIFLHALDIGNIYITELRLQIDRPDVIIRPDVADINLLDRVDVHEVMGRGEAAFAEALRELRLAQRWDRSLVRRWRYREPPSGVDVPIRG